MVCVLCIFFFFSSRRRHTRCSRDWSSDVCSSDLLATITVTNVPVARVTVTPAITSLLMGATLQLTATPTDALGNPLSGRVVTWSTNTPGVATVRGTGLVTGSGVGAVTITATSEGQSGSAAVTVTRVNDSTPLYTLGNGANYYVAPGGSDGNPCTAAAPCYTLQRVSQLMRSEEHTSE